MSRLVALLSIAAMAAVAAACTLDADGAGEVIPVDELKRLTAVEELRIGSVDDPQAGFSRISSIAVADDGTLYVLDGQAREVWVFDRDGRRIGTRGRPGQGPGEFNRPSSIGLMGDTLWVRDGMGGRITWFAPDGTLAHETHGVTLPVDTDVPGMRLTVVIGEPRPDGYIGSTHSRMMGGGAADRPFYVPIVRFDREGAVIDTLRWDTVAVAPTVRVGGTALHPPSLRPRSPVVTSVADDRLVLLWSDDSDLLRVFRLTASGDTIARASLRYLPVPLPADVRDSLLDRPAGMGSFYGVSDAALAAAMAAGLELPAYRPPLRSTRIGVDGSVWIELNGAAPDSADWVVLDGSLEPRGRTRLALRQTPRHISGSTIWAVELDELDVPWLVRLRVE